jgi:D-amino peptidase
VKIFISADMEGVAGVTHPGQCEPGNQDYERFRRLMTAEVNAAIAGAVDGGANEITVNDGHAAGVNLLIEELDHRATLISGENELLCQMEGLDESYDGVFFVGYHQGDGEGDGVVSHTLMSATIRQVRVNGIIVDEAMLNANIAGSFGVPVVLMTGDDCVCDAAVAALPGIDVVCVKRAIDRLSAEHQPITRVREMIRSRATAAVERLERGEATPISPRAPVRFDVEFRSTSSAHMCTLLLGTARTGAREISFEHASFAAAFRHFWGLSILAAAVQDGMSG